MRRQRTPSPSSRGPLSSRSMGPMTLVSSTRAQHRATGRPRVSLPIGRTAPLLHLGARRPRFLACLPTTTIATTNRLELAEPELRAWTCAVTLTSCTQLEACSRATRGTPSMPALRLELETVVPSADSVRSALGPTSGESATPTTSKVHARSRTTIRVKILKPRSIITTSPWTSPTRRSW
jgi:hypothetical protein